MTSSDIETAHEPERMEKIFNAASLVIAIVYAILIIPMVILAAIGLNTVNALGTLFNSWGVYWLCVGNFPITFFVTSLIMWVLRSRKQYSTALVVALLPLIVLVISFFFGFL
jgi:hypothetical protein